jgi:hypothetical protein
METAMKRSELDSQQVEILGRSLVKAALIEAQIEVATPERDNGIDLIAFQWNTTQGIFHARPVQIKASSTFSFSIDKKYAKIPGLIMVFVISCRAVTESAIYAMTYSQMVGIGKVMGWTKTPSWSRGYYSCQHASPKLMTALEPHLMGADKWGAVLGEPARFGGVGRRQRRRG